MRRITDDSFTVTEAQSGVVPFYFGMTTPAFEKMFMLVDGIYPSYSQFILGFKEPVTLQMRNVHSLPSESRCRPF
jgi:hypothetical protein